MTFDYRHPEVLDAVRRALAEDIGSGDVTTNTCVRADAMARGRFIARQSLVLAGAGLLNLIYAERGGVAELNLLRNDGANLAPGDVLAAVRGPARTLLECERTALNFLQRLSGVATVARRYVEAVQGMRCQILDTRKTTPGLRRLEKMAAAAGGVTNHRLGLFDAVLIKNNHITAAGGVRAALERFADCALEVEIEVRTRAELEEALSCGARHLLLDNLTPAEAAGWIRVIAGRATAELSGGITLDSARAYAEAGADFVSVGAITHSAVAVDINFRLELE
jgi:nicotinate-nucleotide pyrophosphorylase (carboxylating)